MHCERAALPEVKQKLDLGASCYSRKERGIGLKKGACGWDEGRRTGGGCKSSATGIYLTKHSCHASVCVNVCLKSGRKRERIMVTQAVWLIQTKRGGPALSPPLRPIPFSTRASIQ